MEHEHGHLELFSALLEEPLEGLLEKIGLSEALTRFSVHVVLDFLEIIALLFIVVAIVSYIQTYVPYTKLKHKLHFLRGFGGYALAVVLGMLSPFCSCSIIPIMMGFLASGVPLSCCLAFLTSASCLNLTALSTLFASFDLRFSLAYLLCALLITVLSSLLLSRMHSEELVHMDKLQAEHHHHHEEFTISNRLVKALCSAWLTFKEVWPMLLIGVLLSTAISVFVPVKFIEKLLSGSFLALPLATLLGGFLHSDVFSMLPILQILYPYSAGVTLSFLLSVMLFSIAEWALLSQCFRWKLIARYCAVLLGMAFLCGLAALVVL